MQKFWGVFLEIEKRKSFLINFCYVTVLVILILVSAKFLLSYLLPFVLAGIIAFLMQRPAEFLQRKLKFKKNITAAFLAVLVYLAVGFLSVFLIYRSSLFLMDLTEKLPYFFEKAGNLIDALNDRFSDILPENEGFNLDSFWQSIFNKATVTVTDVLSSSITALAKNTPSFFISSIVALVASCYIAKDFDRLVKFSRELFGKKVSENIAKIKNILIESVFKLIKGYVILSSLTFLEVFIGLLILRVKYAFFIALLTAIVDVMPVLGTGTVLIPWAVLAAVFGNVSLGIGIGILYIIVILLRNFLEPKVIGAQMGINPLFTLITMFVGLRLFGVVGLFAFPIIFIVTIKYYKE